MNNATVRGNYFQCGFVHQNKIIAAFAQVLEQKMFGDFDGIVCRGVSGLLVSSILANRFNIKLLVARKTNESCHDVSDIAVGDYGINKFIIVDDFVESGNTILECLKCVENTKKSWSFGMIHGENLDKETKMQYIGCFLYNYNRCPMTRILNRTNEEIAAKCCNGTKFVTFDPETTVEPIKQFQY